MFVLGLFSAVGDLMRFLLASQGLWRTLCFNGAARSVDQC